MTEGENEPTYIATVQENDISADKNISAIPQIITSMVCNRDVRWKQSILTDLQWTFADLHDSSALDQWPSLAIKY